jgi:hypothetical protein
LALVTRLPAIIIHTTKLIDFASANHIAAKGIMANIKANDITLVNSSNVGELGVSMIDSTMLIAKKHIDQPGIENKLRYRANSRRTIMKIMSGTNGIGPITKGWPKNTGKKSRNMKKLVIRSQSTHSQFA